MDLIGDVTGCIIVTTPQEVALLDSRKSVNFVKDSEFPVIGIVENMSGMTCPHCHKEIEVFKKGGGEAAALEMRDRKSTRLNSSHGYISYAVFCLKKKKRNNTK